MLAIKLKRIGKKHQVSYRIIVAEKKSKISGRYTEDLGHWNPHTDSTSINKDRALYWISKGAQPTDTIHNILVNQKIIDGAKKAVHRKTPKEKKKK